MPDHLVAWVNRLVTSIGLQSACIGASGPLIVLGIHCNPSDSCDRCIIARVLAWPTCRTSSSVWIFRTGVGAAAAHWQSDVKGRQGHARVGAAAHPAAAQLDWPPRRKADATGQWCEFAVVCNVNLMTAVAKTSHIEQRRSTLSSQADDRLRS